MSKASKDARLKLGDPWAGKLNDFCAANYNCSQIEVIREALDSHIDRRLESEPELRKRFKAARQRRMGSRRNLKVLTPRKSGN